MSNRRISLAVSMRLCAVSLAVLSFLFVTGCATRAIPGVGDARLMGGVHGGQQPIVGAQVYLFAIHAAPNAVPVVTALLPSPATTDANGAFSLDPSSYACTSPADQAFFVAAGGDAGSGANNSAITLVDLFGSCSNLNASSMVAINEVTTVAAAFALAPMYGDAFSYNTFNINGFSTQEFTQIWGNLRGPDQIGQLFTNAQTLVDSQTGSVSTFATASDRQAINSLADAAAACVNSTSNSGPCQSLYSYTWQVQMMPAGDTFSAVLYIAQAPDQMGGFLVALIPPSPPFQPALSTDPQTWAIPAFYNNIPGLNWSPI